MEHDEAAKERLKNIEVEILDNIYDEKEADGVLARDSTNLAASQQDTRSESMENQKAGNNQSQIEMLRKYMDPQMVIEEEESFRYSSGIDKDKVRLPTFNDFPDYDDGTNKMDQLLGLVESPVGEKEDVPRQ